MTGKFDFGTDAAMLKKTVFGLLSHKMAHLRNAPNAAVSIAGPVFLVL